MKRDGFACAVGFKVSGSIVGAAKDFDVCAGLVDEEVFLEAAEFAVVVEFLAAIEGFGTLGEDFDNEFGMLFIVSHSTIECKKNNTELNFCCRLFYFS
jgi:hypothetical protein